MTQTANRALAAPAAEVIRDFQGPSSLMEIVLAAFALLLATVIGFAVHRASLCNVRAVAELLSTKQAHMLGSFFKTVLWVIVVTYLIELLLQTGSPKPVQLWGLSMSALVGGFVFGVGAAVNGGCALGTLGRLGNGELRMLLTLFGLVVGLASAGSAQLKRWLPSPHSVDLADSTYPTLAVIVPVTIALWALWEMGRLWRNRGIGLTWRQLVQSERYRLSTAALLLGISNGIIYFLFGPWSYTRTAKIAVNHVVMGRPGPEILFWFLFSALLGGVLLSSLTRRSFVLDWRPQIDWLRNLLGGVLMGIGVALTPGGNDVLILHTIPSGSPHALPAYAALLVGTAGGLMVIRMLGGAVTKVVCTGDVCRIGTAPKK